MTGASTYNALHHEICVGLGWCGSIVNGAPSHVDFLIPESGKVTADQFVEWVFQAEGYDGKDDPAQAAKYRASLRAAFIKHMGYEIVDAQRLKWS